MYLLYIKQKIVHFFTSENNGASPLIMVDVMAICSLGNLNKTDTLLGGRHQIIIETYKNFFQKLVHHGAKLDFFCDGAVQTDKYDVWDERQNQKYDDSIKIFDAINIGTPISHVINDQSLSISQITTFVKLLMETAKQFGSLKTTNHHECDAELAQYATLNNAMAIVTNDTDFMVFEGNWHLWCVNDLNVELCQCMELNRRALISHLGLSYKQMALFATLSGNDYVRYDRIKHFLSNFGSKFTQFYNLANFIRKMNKQPLNLNDSELSDLAKRLFYDESIENIELIKKSIKSYDLHFEVSHPNESDELLRKSYPHTAIYICLANIPDTMTIGYFDLREPGFIPYVDIVLPIFLRQYGVLLKHKEHTNPIRTIRMKRYHHELFGTYNVVPEYPNSNLICRYINIL